MTNFAKKPSQLNSSDRRRDRRTRGLRPRAGVINGPRFATSTSSLSSRIQRDKMAAIEASSSRNANPVETLCESVVHRREELSRIVLPILPDSRAGKAEGNPQFPRAGILLPGHLDRVGEAAFGRRDGLFICSVEQ
jgi:hypothetical protein